MKGITPSRIRIPDVGQLLRLSGVGSCDVSVHGVPRKCVAEDLAETQANLVYAEIDAGWCHRGRPVMECVDFA